MAVPVPGQVRKLTEGDRQSILATVERLSSNDLQIAKVYWTQLGHEGHEEGERKRAQQANASAPSRPSIRPRATCVLWWATRLACA